jgi:hypothetical protein
MTLWRGMRGLGQEEGWVPVIGGDGGGTPPFVGTGPITGASGSSTSTTPWLVTDIIAPVLKAGSTIASYELNPLYQQATYYRTPQGAVYASNVPSGYVPGLTTATGGISHPACTSPGSSCPIIGVQPEAAAMRLLRPSMATIAAAAAAVGRLQSLETAECFPAVYTPPVTAAAEHMFHPSWISAASPFCPNPRMPRGTAARRLNGTPPPQSRPLHG